MVQDHIHMVGQDVTVMVEGQVVMDEEDDEIEIKMSKRARDQEPLLPAELSMQKVMNKSEMDHQAMSARGENTPMAGHGEDLAVEGAGVAVEGDADIMEDGDLLPLLLDPEVLVEWVDLISVVSLTR